MAKTILLTADDGFPSDFTHKRVSTALDRKGEILAYKHLLFGWVDPKISYMLKLVIENAKDVIGWGYQVNFKIIDMLIPSGGALVGAVTGIGDIALFLSLKDYADDIYRANPDKTTPEKEYAKLLLIMSLPFGMVYIIGMGVFNIGAKDWGKIVFGEDGFPGEEIKPGEKSDDPLTAILNFIFGLLGPWDPMNLPRI